MSEKENQIQNLNTIMTLLLQQYQDFVSRKERLENKALGYLTPLSIFLASMVAIIIMVSQSNKNGYYFYFLLIAFFGQVYFSIWTFFFALKAYSLKYSEYPDIKEYSKEWSIRTPDFFLGGINKAFIKTIDNLNKLLEKLIFHVIMCKIYLIFSVSFGIIGIVIFIFYVLQ